MMGFGRRRVAVDRGGWTPRLLDQCGLPAIAHASEGVTASTAADTRRRKPGRTKRRVAVGLRMAMLGLAVLTILGLAVGVTDIAAGGLGLAAFARLALLVLVAIGFCTQLAGLVKMVPGVRSLQLRRPKPVAPVPPLLLDQAPLSAISAAAASLPPVAAVGPSRARTWMAGGSWFALALGVVALLFVALTGAAIGVVVLAVRGDLFGPAGALAGGITAMLGVGLWATIRMVIRSIGEARLRKRKRALRQLLRALLQWLLRGGSRAGRPVVVTAGVNAALLCLLAVSAVAVGIAPAVFGGADDDVVSASGDDDDREGPSPTRTPTPTPTRSAGGAATPTRGGGSGDATSGTSQDQSGSGSDSTQTPGSGPSGSATRTPTPSGGNPGATATHTSTPPPGSTATRTPTRTPTPRPGSTSTPTRTPTRTPTATPTPGFVIEPPPYDPPTSTPTPEPKPTSTPTPKPTATPLPTATPTQVPGPCTTPLIPSLNCDGDTATNGQEQSYGSDPYNANSTPEHIQWGISCSDGKDNDLDGKTDYPQEGAGPGQPCEGIIL